MKIRKLVRKIVNFMQNQNSLPEQKNRQFSINVLISVQTLKVFTEKNRVEFFITDFRKLKKSETNLPLNL